MPPLTQAKPVSLLSQLRIYFADQPRREKYFHAARHWTFVTRAHKSIAVRLVQFLIVDQRNTADAKQGKVLRARTAKAADPGDDYARGEKVALSFFTKQAHVAIVSLR